MAEINDSSSDTDLVSAVEDTYYGVARELLAQGANPNIPDASGDTALDLARYNLKHCSGSHKDEIIELLIAHGAKGKDGPSFKEQYEEAYFNGGSFDVAIHLHKAMDEFKQEQKRKA